MLRTLRTRLGRRTVTEDDPRGGPDLRWLPVVRDPAAVRDGTCPTAALRPGQDALRIGACIQCGACGRTGAVEWTPGVPRPGAADLSLAAGATLPTLEDLERRRKRLHGLFGRSLAVRHLDVGSCNGCDAEIQAMTSPFTDLERFGIRFVASPRHADVLLVTGVVTRNLAEALVRTVAATPEPRAVVALGACGLSGGIFAESPHVLGGVHKLVPVDVQVPGCPPPPEAILAGLFDAAEILATRLKAAPRADSPQS